MALNGADDNTDPLVSGMNTLGDRCVRYRLPSVGAASAATLRNCFVRSSMRCTRARTTVRSCRQCLQTIASSLTSSAQNASALSFLRLGRHI
jgi:hypothetical protein